ANRIEPGMTLEEIEQILGPERDETYGDWTFFPQPTISLVITKNGPLYQSKRWISREIVITIEMDTQIARVHSVWTSEPIPVELSTWEKLQYQVKALFKL